MILLNKKLLKKFLNKNKGNRALNESVMKLLRDFESNTIKTPEELISIRPDADKVNSNHVYFFNLKIHRTLIMIKFEQGHSTILWCGNHDKYEEVFKNNKGTIKKWLKSKNFIE